MREVKKYSPEKNCRLEYDKLRVDGKTFIFREVLGRKLNTDRAIQLYHHHYYIPKLSIISTLVIFL